MDTEARDPGVDEPGDSITKRRYRNNLREARRALLAAQREVAMLEEILTDWDD